MVQHGGMDITATALTVAWLDAVRRVQSDAVRRFRDQVPQVEPAADERMLTDVIESALVNGGMQLQDPAAGPHQVDKLA